VESRGNALDQRLKSRKHENAPGTLNTEGFACGPRGDVSLKSVFVQLAPATCLPQQAPLLIRLLEAESESLLQTYHYWHCV
jgi:hypothetical protein